MTAEAPPKGGQERNFAFVTLDGKAATSAGYRGRMTLIGFAATFDIGSQAQARFINEVARKHTPRINALLLVLEPPEHRPMVEAFASSLNLGYDVVHADASTTASGGPFAGHNNVPSVILLDREGREVWKNLGLIEAGPLSQAIAEHDERAR